MKSILVVQTAWLGDVVLTTPLFRELRRAHPRALLTALVTPLGAEILAGSPDLDEVVALDKRGGVRSLLRTWRSASRLRAARFDLALAAQRSFRTGLLLRASGAPVRVGFEGSGGAWACTERVSWVASAHAVERYLALAAPAGGAPGRADPRPALAVLPRARDEVSALLASEGVGADEPRVAVAPGSIWGTKRWLPGGFAEVARRARERGLRPVLIGAPSERELCEEVASLAACGAVVLAGRTSIPQMSALLAACRLLVSNDSGPGHVASAVGTPVVSVFGPTVPAFGYTPYGEANRIVEILGLECRPCHSHGPARCPLGHHRCMREIGAERVWAAAEEILALG